MATLPPNLRGNYNRFGWTANGTEPWGLQKDPIGADGYLFFRGWFHLLLAPLTNTSRAVTNGRPGSK